MTTIQVADVAGDPRPNPLRRGKAPTVDRPAFFAGDCIAGAARELRDGSVDLIVTDPPYGIDGDLLHRHYNRDEDHVIDGYVEVPRAEYAEFSRRWIREAARVLRPGGSLYVVSGYTNLYDILTALRETILVEVNHIVWKYNFGVYTSRKYVSSHYHVLFYEKPGGRRTFHQFARHAEADRDERGGSRLYQDLEDVWIINREYKPGQTKNKNELPRALLGKILQYSSDPGDVVCDFFLGSFSTAKVAKGMNRVAIGFERNARAFAHQSREVAAVRPGELLAELPTGRDDRPARRSERWSEADLDQLARRFRQLTREGRTKAVAMEVLQGEFERGRFSILNALKRRDL